MGNVRRTTSLYYIVYHLSNKVGAHQYNEVYLYYRGGTQFDIKM